LPVPGASGLEWSGFIPLDQLPRQFNPTVGFYATANNKTTPENYPYTVGFEWSQTRVERIDEVLNQARDSGTKLSVKDMEDLQNDVTSLPARELMPLLREAMAKQPNKAAEAGKLLLSWDGRLAENSAAAAVYEVWFHGLTSTMSRRMTARDPHYELNITPVAMLRLLLEPAAIFANTTVTGGSGCNMQTLTVDSETARDNFILDSLNKAWLQLEKLQGPDATQWSWGKLHRVSWHHALDKNKEWAEMLDPAGAARPGDGNTVDATGGTGYAQTHGASYREIFDLADWDRSVAIDVPGESGQPGSPHYADLLPLWEKGEYFSLAFTRAAVERSKPARLELRP
jgi:penicillin amidase